MESNNFYTRYDEILTDKEIYNYALIVDEFMKGQITYKELQEKFSKEYGIEVNADATIRTIMTLEEFNDFCNRKSREDYEYNDISCFILSGKDFRNVLFRLDYKAIEVLANNNVRYYMEVYKAILETQIRHSYDKNEKLKAKRNMWKRRVAELQKELSIDTDKLTNSVKEAVKSDNVNTDLMSVYIDEQGKLKTIGPKLTRKKDDK